MSCQGHRGGSLPDEDDDEGTCTRIFKRIIVSILEFLGLVLQIGALIAIPVLLSELSNDYQNDKYHPSTLILLPVTLSLISLLWSGWVQEKLMEPRSQWGIGQDEMGYARLKAGQLDHKYLFHIHEKCYGYIFVITSALNYILASTYCML